MFTGLALLALAQPPKIDVPVRLKEANAVFNVLHVSPAAPAQQDSLHLARILTSRLTTLKVRHSIIVVFHSEAARLACKDAAYDRIGQTTGGNPYAPAIAGLQKLGVQTEICAVSMEAQKIENADLLPGIRVNTGALLRIIELTQKGYTQFSF